MPARNLAPRTRREYSHDLTDLITFLEYSGVDRVGEIGLAHLDRYLAILDERGLSGSTRKRKAISIRTFLGFLYRERFISNDISRQVIVPFEESSTPRVLSQSECDRLREACGSNLRDRAIIELLLQTGIRLSELVRLKVNDIDSPGPGKPVWCGLRRVLGERAGRFLSTPRPAKH
ncbi:MAG: XerD [Candidatus Amesbacteria bacterium GW2011_GWA1_47_16]|uniref:XerD n=1 Tax=Candidatus Amesbacteria bacterium GW2011_GWA1_47_16 TaxID=1618353 RepID=A0A0G1UZZ7_9BACT|nr:MAG: XerD [Candidatus Amesbacteria bacterium GW2011_GWA1_47_16]